MSAMAGIHFQSGGTFYAELKRRVRDELARDGTPTDGGAPMRASTAALLGWLALSYAALLTLGARSPVLSAALTLSAALAAAGIGFGVMHDACHGSYAAGPRLNRLAALSLDLIGGSSYVWRFKHNVLHHTYTNVAGVDTDVDAQPMLRLAPSQPWRPYHRYQHLYAWPLYGMLALKWWFVDDFRNVLAGRVGGLRFPRPRGRALLALLGGKAVFYGWSIALPLVVFRSAWPLAYLAGGAVVLGLVLATVFQLAHCLGEVEFEVAPPTGERRDAGDWAEHQVRTTADFARGHRLLGWYLGGLNYQVEHHLFPQVSHRHYPRLAPIVEATATAHGLRYRSFPTLAAALRANVRWMRALGRPPPEAKVARAASADQGRQALVGSAMVKTHPLPGRS